MNYDNTFVLIMIGNKAGYKEWLGLAALALPTLLLSIDTSVLYLALPKLSISLKAGSGQQLWIMDIYGFMIAGFLITMGNLGDQIGYRKLLIAGSVVFGMSSILAAFSPNATLLIMARAIMGTAGAALMPSTLALIRNMFIDPKQLGAAISVWMSCFMTGMVAGPLVGGIVLEHYWWGAVFLLGVPVMLIIILFGKILLPEYSHSKTNRLDIVGVLYSLGGILPLIYGITELSRINFQPISIAAIIAGILFGLLFIRRERSRTEPIIDYRLFQSKPFRLTLVSMLLTAVIMGGVALFVAQYLQMVLRFSPFIAGLWMVPQALAMIVSSLSMQALTKKFSPSIIITIGFIVATLGMLSIAFTPVINGLQVLEIGFVISIIGVSPVLILGTGIIISAVPAEKAGAAASISETGNQLGIALGVALLGGTGTLIYHIEVMTGLSEDRIPKRILGTISESIAGAYANASGLDIQSRLSMLSVVEGAFVSGLKVVAILGAATFAVLAWLTFAWSRASKRNLQHTITMQIKT